MAEDTVSIPSWARFHDAERMDMAQRFTREGRYNLLPSEQWWRDKQQMLLSNGYMLRPRFRPGWVPSWLGNDRIPTYCEDSVPNGHPKTIDATRVSDGTLVCIKRVPKDTQEVDIGCYLTAAQRIANNSNHCVPILDIIQDEADRSHDFIVMPYLRKFNSPAFQTVTEVLDFMSQTLEGLVYLHEQQVAHRDLSYLNIMLDATTLYPEGFHPTRLDQSPNLLRPAKVLRRSDVPSVKYYFTDFGLSTRFDVGAETRMVTGAIAQDAEVPELSSTIPYDPFAVDVFTLGNVYKKQLVLRFLNLAFLEPLTTAMTLQNPKERPTAAQAFAQLETLVSQQSQVSLKWRLQPISESLTKRILGDFSFITGRLLRYPLILAVVILSSTGTALSVLYGPQAILDRLKSLTTRTRNR